MMVAGYEFRTFACSSCHDVERRLTFSREPTPQLDQLVSVDSTKAAVPPSQERDNAPLPASYIKAERLGRCLTITHLQHVAGIADIGHDRQPAETRDNLAQELESLARKIGRLV
jgi:hypothetical protein